MLSLKPEHLKRYKDVALLLLKYGRGDLVKRAGLSEACGVALVIVILASDIRARGKLKN